MVAEAAQVDGHQLVGDVNRSLVDHAFYWIKHQPTRLPNIHRINGPYKVTINT